MVALLYISWLSGEVVFMSATSGEPNQKTIYILRKTFTFDR